MSTRNVSRPRYQLTASWLFVNDIGILNFDKNAYLSLMQVTTSLNFERIVQFVLPDLALSLLNLEHIPLPPAPTHPLNRHLLFLHLRKNLNHCALCLMPMDLHDLKVLFLPVNCLALQPFPVCQLGREQPEEDLSQKIRARFHIP